MEISRSSLLCRRIRGSGFGGGSTRKLSMIIPRPSTLLSEYSVNRCFSTAIATGHQIGSNRSVAEVAATPVVEMT